MAGRRGTITTDDAPASQEPQIAFPAHDEPSWDPAVAVHVNFGVLAGREATPAEIERLARSLLDRLDKISIVSEVRYEIDRHSEAAVHQVRVEALPAEGTREELESWLIGEAERWARACTRSPV